MLVTPFTQTGHEQAEPNSPPLDSSAIAYLSFLFLYQTLVFPNIVPRPKLAHSTQVYAHD